MAKELTITQIRGYLDEKGITSRIDSDGDLYIVLSADEDFDHDVFVYFGIEDNWVRIFGLASNFDVEDHNKARVLFTINELNKKKRQPKGYLSGSRIVAEQYYCISEGISETYIKDKIIMASISFIWRFFCDFNE